MDESPKRYRAPRQFLWLALVAVAISVFSGWVALRWEYAWIAASLALASAILLFLLALQPPIEIHGTHLRVGKREIAWDRVPERIVTEIRSFEAKALPVFGRRSVDGPLRLIWKISESCFDLPLLAECQSQEIGS